MAVVYPQGQRFQRPERSLQVLGVHTSQIDPVETLGSEVYRVPLHLTRTLTEFEERALEDANLFAFEIVGSTLYIESSLETILEGGGAEKIAEALDQAARVGEERRAATQAEQHRIEQLGESIEFKFTKIFHAGR